MRLVDPEVWKLDLLLFHGCNEKTAWLIDRINHAPTIDAVPVIRCKDCKYNPENAMSYLDDDLIEGYIHCGHLGDEGFCSLGKRKEE